MQGRTTVPWVTIATATQRASTSQPDTRVSVSLASMEMEKLVQVNELVFSLNSTWCSVFSPPSQRQWMFSTWSLFQLTHVIVQIGTSAQSGVVVTGTTATATRAA